MALGKFVGLLGLLGVKKMMEPEEEVVVDQKDLKRAEMEAEKRYDKSPAAIHKSIYDNRSEEDKKLDEKIKRILERK
jgi:hypothetical protein